MELWPNRLRSLQKQLGKTQEEFASMLGITARTLSEFLRPDGREPTPPIQKLVEMLEGGSKEIAPIAETTSPQKMNLVIIHGDFATHNGGDVVTVIDSMSKTDDESSNIEFHYITVNPERDMSKARAILQNKRVTPHFFMHDPALQNSEISQCSYFSTTTAWLVSVAKQNNLGHITLAANVQKFWPVANELKALAEVDVSFIQGANSDINDAEKKALDDMGINIISIGQSVRHHGIVRSLRDPAKYSGFGYLEYAKQNAVSGKSEWESQGGKLFFSWNHMRKLKNMSTPETYISDLNVGDIVSFAIGMNNEGACATDVTLIARAQGTSTNNSVELIDILKDAIDVCADENGWALVSAIGSRLAVLMPEYKDKLKSFGYDSIKDSLMKNSGIFEYSSNGDGTNYSAACTRLKQP